MSDVEGLWQFESGLLFDQNQSRWAGAMVLQGGRVLGGDSAIAYSGTYTIEDGSITINVRSWTWRQDAGQDSNFFGVAGGIDYDAVIVGALNGDTIKGHLSPKKVEEIILPCSLTKVAGLP